MNNPASPKQSDNKLIVNNDSLVQGSTEKDNQSISSSDSLKQLPKPKNLHRRDRTVTFDDEVTKIYGSYNSDKSRDCDKNDANAIIDTYEAIASSQDTIKIKNDESNNNPDLSSLFTPPQPVQEKPPFLPEERSPNNIPGIRQTIRNTIRTHNLQKDFGVSGMIQLGSNGKKAPSMRAYEDNKLVNMKTELASKAWDYSSASLGDSLNYSEDDDSTEESNVEEDKKNRKSKVTIQESEAIARQAAISGYCTLFLLEGYASAKVFFKYLLSLNSLFGCMLSITFTILTYNKTIHIEGWSAGIDWVLLSFAVIMPMSVSLGYSFRRRDTALFDIATFRSNAVQIYLCFALWKWKEEGDKEVPIEESDRKVLWLNACDTLLEQLIGISDELCRFLTLPTATTSRHRVTKLGKREAAKTIEVAYRLFDSLTTKRITKIGILLQSVKDSGFTDAEGGRINLWTRNMLEAMDNLRVAKMYRTPEALRSFARLFTTLLPPFYAPNFAQVARDSNSLALGLSFAVITSLALTALFNSIIILEDPFIAYITLDGIDCREEFSVLFWHQMINARKMIFPAAFPFPKYRVDEDGFAKGLRAIEGGGRLARGESKDELAGLDIRVSAYTTLPDARNDSQVGFGDEEMGGMATSSRSLRSRARTLSNMVASALKSSNAV